ncbi:uncharacterized protein LOC144908749 [Branchiostoma floridae x Branchiostoma belcheri]
MEWKGCGRFCRNFRVFWEFLAVFLCISCWANLSAAQELHPHGINVCAYSESYTGTHITTSQMTRQTRTWDWGCLPFVRCKTKTVYFTMYRVGYLTRYRQVYRCCPGWLQDGDVCPTPTCDPECDPEHGTCTGANYCTCANGWRGPTCADRCPPGYMGANCVATCPAGKHGQDCLEDCRCEHGATCRGTDGFCNCTAGWRGEHCNVPCPGGTAGLDCELQCNCAEHGTCNPFTGDCLCDAGYHGNRCESECSEGRYGPGCLFSCHCPGNNSVCRPRDGKCMCDPGWTGDSCTVSCPFGYYGDGCSQKCACHHGNSCDHVTGRCHCPMGYTGERCENEIATVLTAASTADSVSHGNVLVFYIVVAVAMGVLLIVLVLSLAVCRRRRKACFHKRETSRHPMELETLMVTAPVAECAAVNEENRKNSFTQRQCMVVVKSGAPRKYTKLPDQPAGVSGASGAPPDVAGAVGGQVTFAEVAAAAKGTSSIQQQNATPANLYEDVEIPPTCTQSTVTVKKQPSFWQKLSRKGTKNDEGNKGSSNKRVQDDDTIYEEIARVRKEAAKKEKKKKKKAQSSEPTLPTANPLPTTPDKNFYMPLVHPQTPLPRVTSVVSEGDRTSHIYACVDYSKATTPATGAGDEPPVPASPGGYDYIGNAATPSRDRMTGTSTDGAVSVAGIDDIQPSYENVPKPAESNDSVFAAENDYVNDVNEVLTPYEEMKSVANGNANEDNETGYETPRPLSERSSSKTQYEDMTGSTPILDKISKEGKEGRKESEDGGISYEKMGGGSQSLPDILL